MTDYSGHDLREDWEFKILRSSTGAFRKAENLRKVLDQESRAGWKLVEKFDNSRIRVKRPATAREQDGSLDFNPYRTTVGISEGGLAVLILGCILGVGGLLILFLVMSSTKS